MPFMTIPEAAVLWHISAAELRQLCENHAIIGAVRVHQRWFIPEDAACPSGNPSRILNLVGGLSMAQTDLQIHSSLTADGELSPRALAERCCEERLTLAALTDRRAVSGVPECIWRGAQLGVRIVPGIELDCRWREQDFLTLGIGIDITCPALLEIERTRNDSVQSFAAEQAIHTIHEAGGLAVLVPPNEMDDTFPVAAFDGIAAYGSHSRADTARYHTLARRHGLVVTGGSGFLSEDKPPYRPGAVDFYGHEPQVAAAFLAAIYHLNEEKRSFHHDSI